MKIDYDNNEITIEPETLAEKYLLLSYKNLSEKNISIKAAKENIVLFCRTNCADEKGYFECHSNQFQLFREDDQWEYDVDMIEGLEISFYW